MGKYDKIAGLLAVLLLVFAIAGLLVYARTALCTDCNAVRCQADTACGTWCVCSPDPVDAWGWCVPS